MSLIVTCDSLNNNVKYSVDGVGLLSTITWHVDGDCAGFLIENSDILVNMYHADFYTMDEAASLQFIMNVAEKIKNDRSLNEIIYQDSSGKVLEFPFFLPYTIPEEALVVFPQQQLLLCDLWKQFKKTCNGYLDIDLLEHLDSHELETAFLDLINVELSLLYHGFFNKE